MTSKTKAAKSSAKPVPLHARDSATLAVGAAAALAASHYKEATELYKELIKRERRPTWVEALASCYGARAHDLAAKHMFKEALVLWRNRAQSCGKPIIEGAYLAWLSQGGEHAEMFRLLNEGQLSGTALAELEIRLAPVVLAASAKAMPKLPPECALLRHHATILEALAAYHRGHFAAMDEQLRALPFRSPYRDLKPILKALALFHTDAGAAPAAVARLPIDSAFASMVTLLRTAVLPDPEWLAALPGLDEHSRHLLLDLKGCPDALRALLLDLAKLGVSCASAVVPAALYDVLVRHRLGLPEGGARLCRRILPHVSSRLRHHGEIFGPLAGEEQERILALAQEIAGSPERAAPHWKRVADMLAPRDGQQLNAALIWRHLADPERKGVRDGASLDCLKRSVALDPGQCDTQLSLVKALRASGDARGADACLKLALAHLPKDVDLLLEAVQGALAAKAFKKAAGLAKQVLELDPINQPVRALTGQALLSHARKQIKAGNVDAAKKEIAAASEWLRAPSDLASLKLLSALIGDDAGGAGDAALREAARALGDAVVGSFRLLLEAGRIGRNPQGLLARAGIALACAPSAEAVMALARRLGTLRGEDKLVRAALLPLHGPLRRAASANFSQSDLCLLCETFHRYNEETLLSTYAAAGLKAWPARPTFVYYAHLGRYGDKPHLMPERDRSALIDAEDLAGDEGDLRTVERIGRLLDAVDAAQGYGGDDAFDATQGDAQALLRGFVSIAGESAFLKMSSDMLGKRAFEALKKQIGGDRGKLITALIEIMAQMGPPSMGALSAIDRLRPFVPAQIVDPTPRPLAPACATPNPQKDLFND